MSYTDEKEPVSKKKQRWILAGCVLAGLWVYGTVNAPAVDTEVAAVSSDQAIVDRLAETCNEAYDLAMSGNGLKGGELLATVLPEMNALMEIGGYPKPNNFIPVAEGVMLMQTSAGNEEQALMFFRGLSKCAVDRGDD